MMKRSKSSTNILIAALALITIFEASIFTAHSVVREAASEIIESTIIQPPSYEVLPVRAYLTEYQDKHRIILDAIRASGAPIPERTARYDREMRQLKDQFRNVRRTEFESKSIEVSRGHSCTSKSSGGKKDCKWKCATAPHSDLYTQRTWVRIKGDNKGLDVKTGEACIRMTVSGKGRNSGTVFAIFKYRPEAIERRVTQDVIDLFILIGENKDIRLE